MVLVPVRHEQRVELQLSGRALPDVEHHPQLGAHDAGVRPAHGNPAQRETADAELVDTKFFHRPPQATKCRWGFQSTTGVLAAVRVDAARGARSTACAAATTLSGLTTTWSSRRTFWGIPGTGS